MQEQIIQKAKILYDLDRYDEVVSMLHKEMASMEDVQGAWLFSSSLMMLDEMQKALKGAEQGLRISPDYFPLLLLRAEIFKRLSLYSKASPAIEQALQIAPDNPTCHVVASSIFLATDHYKQAIKHADKALSLEPESVDARIVKAYTLYLQEHEQEAQELYFAADKIVQGIIKEATTDDEAMETEKADEIKKELPSMEEIKKEEREKANKVLDNSIDKINESNDEVESMQRHWIEE